MTHATNYLREAAARMDDRAVEYDKPGGERSMKATVAAFAAITGHDLAESEGWLFMEILKNVRLFSAPGFHRDSAEDGIAYGALKAEAREAECRAAEMPGVRIAVEQVYGTPGAIGTVRRDLGVDPLPKRDVLVGAGGALAGGNLGGTGGASKVGTCVRPPCDRYGCKSYCGARSPACSAAPAPDQDDQAPAVDPLPGIAPANYSERKQALIDAGTCKSTSTGIICRECRPSLACRAMTEQAIGATIPPGGAGA